MYMYGVKKKWGVNTITTVELEKKESTYQFPFEFIGDDYPTRFKTTQDMKVYDVSCDYGYITITETFLK